MSNKTPRGERLIITFIGRRNAGKSSLINAIAGQDIALVSDIAGTTTDPVHKHYELLPLGPVTFYDTAGIDDIGELGEKRVRATKKVLWKSDMVMLVTDENGLGEIEKETIQEIKRLSISFIIVFNKLDKNKQSVEDMNYCIQNGLNFIRVSATTGQGIEELKNLIIDSAPKELTQEIPLVGDLIKGGDIVALVVPIDLAAPKGRLILPQVQVIRDILDNDAIAVTVKEREIEEIFSAFSKKPVLVITDSQVVLKVSGDIPTDINLTTFSTIFARYKGDLNIFVNGANYLDKLKDGDKVLIAEACSHHVQADDIGRVKIPRWINQYTGKDITFEVVSGSDFPENLEHFNLVIHCGACMITRMEMKRRINECKARGVPITNYGILISKIHGVLNRIIAPFNLN